MIVILKIKDFYNPFDTKGLNRVGALTIVNSGILEIELESTKELTLTHVEM
jgi:hypothetical protein